MKHRSIFSSPPPVNPDKEKPKRKWVVLPIIWVAFKRMLMVIGAMVLFSAMISVFTLSTTMQNTVPTLPKEMVLYLEFDGGIDEVPAPANFADPFALGAPTLRELVDAIDRAKNDARVKGIMARLKGGAYQPAHVEEIRAALRRFQESGKFTKIYSSSYGDAGGGLGRYYLASAFDEIWMQPLGVVSIAGMNAEMPFARGLLEKIGITPQFLKRKEYKTAYESLTDVQMSAQNREMLTGLVDDIVGTLSESIAIDRGMTLPEFRSLMDQGLFIADQALERKLIDRSDYADVLVAEIREDLTGDPENEELEFIPVKSYYNASMPSPMGVKERVALIYASGAIIYSGKGGGLPSEGIAAAEDIVPAIMDAVDDDSIDVIILRVDSPGGSPAASESILRAIERAKEKDKVILVSMGPTAASGGYWVAAYADQIFVLPTTITGSIGVVGGKFVLKDLWKKIGVNWDGVKIGQNAGIWSANTEFSKSEKRQVDAMLDNIYDSFIARVAKGRNMSEAAVDAIAGGRVWSGKAALSNGLADQAGGLRDALDYAAQLTLENEQANADDIEIVILPKPKTPLEQFLKLFGEQVVFMDWIRNVKTQFSVFSQDPAMTYELITVK